MPDILTIGSALVDVFVQSPDFQLQQTDKGVVLCQTYGDKVEIDSFVLQTGGGGSNTAVGFRRLGFHTGVVAELGQDSLAQLVTADLDAEQVETKWLIKEKKEETGGSVILVGPDGGRTVMVHRGAASQLDLADIPFSAVEHAKWIHLSSIGGKLDILTRLFSQVQQQQLGLSWNPGKGELELIAQGKLPTISARIFLVNQEEWDSVLDQQARLLEQLPTIVITNGRQGGKVYVQGQGPFEYQLNPDKAVDDTGAGDGFAVGFVAAHLLGYSWHEATQWGSANAASVVQHLGAKPGLLGRSELERIIET